MGKKYKISQDRFEKMIYRVLEVMLKGLYLSEKPDNPGWIEWKIPGRKDMVLGSTNSDQDHIYYDGTYFSLVWKMMGFDSDDIKVMSEYLPIFVDTLAKYLRDQGIIFKTLS
jgi:hypothetical protein